ncbi:PQQ-like beta-propeller repeat protein [Candidatus Sumerlaeota bacterium]|nr:PQQ-like beta-propeller repeat protein [Candidatus Sumerlaeota bacterium]
MSSQSPLRSLARPFVAGSVVLFLVALLYLPPAPSRAAGNGTDSHDASWLLEPEEPQNAASQAPTTPGAISAGDTVLIAPSPTLEASATLGATSPTLPNATEARVTTATPTPAPTPFILEPEPLPKRDDGTIWPTVRQWNLDEERLFAEWIRNNVDEDFFVRHKIVTDCADVPYSLRFIFARMRGLPQGVHDYHGRVFGNWTTEFARLKRHRDWALDQRFGMALRRMMYDYTLVRSICEDTYPIDPWPEAGMVRPGTVFCNEQHSGIVYSVNRANFFPIKVAYSTLPPKIRPLILINYEEELTYRDIGQGLVNWNWWRKNPETGAFEIVPDEKMPGYSEEQYKHPEGLALRLHAAYSVGRKDKRMALDEMMRNFHSAVQMRIPVVEEGYQVYRGRPKDRDRGSALYDSFSTPGRDARLRNELEDMDEMVKNNVFSDIELVDRLRQERFHPPGLPEATFLEFRHAMLGGLVSPEPWDTPARRWGVCREAHLEWMRQAPREGDSVWMGPENWIYVLRKDRPVLRVTPDGKVDLDPPALPDAERDRRRAVDRLRRTYSLTEASPDPLPLGDGSAAIVESGGRVFVVDAEGETVWEKKVNSHLYASPATAQDGTIYLPVEEGFLLALDSKTGETKWRLGLGERLIYAPVVGASGTVFISGTNTVFSVTPKGKVRWRQSLPEAIYASPGVGPNEQVYSGCLDAKLYTFSRDGRLLWTFPTLSSVLVPPVGLADGRVYALSTSGVLYCLQKR